MIAESLLSNKDINVSFESVYIIRVIVKGRVFCEISIREHCSKYRFNIEKDGKYLYSSGLGYKYDSPEKALRDAEDLVIKEIRD